MSADDLLAITRTLHGYATCENLAPTGVEAPERLIALHNCSTSGPYKWLVRVALSRFASRGELW